MNCSECVHKNDKSIRIIQKKNHCETNQNSQSKLHFYLTKIATINQWIDISPLNGTLVTMMQFYLLLLLLSDFRFHLAKHLNWFKFGYLHATL